MMAPAATALGVHLRVLVEDAVSSAAQVVVDAPVGVASDPVAVERLVGRAGELNYGQAMALSTILMLVCAITLLALERARTNRSGEF